MGLNLLSILRGKGHIKEVTIPASKSIHPSIWLLVLILKVFTLILGVYANL